MAVVRLLSGCLKNEEGGARVGGRRGCGGGQPCCSARHGRLRARNNFAWQLQGMGSVGLNLSC